MTRLCFEARNDTPSNVIGTMIAAVAVTLLLLLELARRGLEPECPGCAAKQWTSHSTQLQCVGCGWSNVAPVAATPAEAPQYEIGLTV